MELIVIGAVVYLLYRRFGRRDVASAPPGMIGPVGWSPTTNWSVTTPLGRAEVRRVLLHPAFLSGVAVTPFILMLATFGQSKQTWLNATTGTALGLVPLGWMTIVVSNLVALRPQRNGTSELLAAAPAPQAVRTTALLATALGPATVATVVGGGWMTYLASRDDLHGSPSWAEAAAGVFIVIGAVAVGVAVARWLPNPAFGLVAVVAVILIQARFIDVTTWPWNRNEGDPLRFLGFLAEPTSAGAEFLEFRPAGWHLLYLAGCIAIMAGVALTRDGRYRIVTVTLAVGVGAAAGAGFVQTRPLSTSQRDAMVGALVDPSAYQVCEESPGVRYCAYSEYRVDIDEWSGAVEATLAVLPVRASNNRPHLEVLQRPGVIIGDGDCSPLNFIDGLAPDVASRVSPAELWPPDGMVHPTFENESFPCSDRDVHGFFLAVQTAAWATRLPPTPHDANVRCTATGQARAAITLWAGAAASFDGASTLRDLSAEGSTDNGRLIGFADWESPPTWGVDYAVADAQAALAMLERPVQDVRTALGENWDELIDPNTPTSALTRVLRINRGDTEPTGSDSTMCP